MYQYAFRLIPGRLKNVLLAATIFGLVTMNIATLVSDSFHNTAFAALGTAMGYTMGSKLTDKMLNQSPMMNRKNDVALATQELSRKNQALQRQSDKLEKVIDKKSVAIKKFSQRMAARSAIATTRNLSSLTGEAVPILGIAVLAGVTAWNIHDSCETIKELNALSTELDLQSHLEKENQKVCGVDVPSKEQIWAEVQENWFIAYEKARVAINQETDEMPDMPKIPELSSAIKKYWTMLQATLERFMKTIPDFWEQGDPSS
jgi:DNA-binding helix-hairpin-helix protein with protein kinase domain